MEVSIKDVKFKVMYLELKKSMGCESDIEYVKLVEAEFQACDS